MAVHHLELVVRDRRTPELVLGRSWGTISNSGGLLVGIVEAGWEECRGTVSGV